MAGARFVERLCSEVPGAWQVTLFGEEPGDSYNRVLLSRVLAGEVPASDLTTLTADWCARHGVELISDRPITAIDREQRKVIDDLGHAHAYDLLVLATGSRPIMLPLPGSELRGVYCFRTLTDVERLQAYCRRGGSAVVIGGGLLGLEAAHGLQLGGMQTTIVHLADRLMERQLDMRAAALLQETLTQRGLRVETGTTCTAFEGLDGHVAGAILDDGRRLAADLVLFCIGVRPETSLAEAAGLACERGVVVNDQLRTSDEHIYAIGECTQHRGTTYGLVAPLWEQIDALINFLAGREASYEGSVTFSSLKVSGVQVFSAGDFAAEHGGETLVLEDKAGTVYRRLTVRDGRLTGACLYGDTSHQQWYSQLITEAQPLGALRHTLMFGPQEPPMRSSA